MDDRSPDPGRAAAEALERLVRERLARLPGGHLVDSRLAALDVAFRVALRGAEADPARRGERLCREIDRRLAEAVRQVAAFRPGRAYCHRCGGPDCEHARPPSCRHVFAGYAATGLPRWEDFAQHCLDRRHPLVDRLFEDPPALIVLVDEPAALQGGLLRAFRNGDYDLLGQLTAGFFRMRGAVPSGRGVAALSLHVAATHGQRGQPRLALNLLGLAPSGEDVALGWAADQEPPWRRALRWGQAALDALEASGRPRRGGRRAAARAELERRASGILHGMARRIARQHRARSRKTRHAQERHETGGRPTPKALDDARSAGVEALLVDERRGTLVVLGERGRTHFFSPDGQHVSSVRYSRDAIARKLKLELWRQASSGEVASFREKLGPP